MNSDDDLYPGMVIVTLVEHESATQRHCPHCHAQLAAGDRVFESLDAQTVIHVTCVTALALIATLQGHADVGA